MARHNLHSFTLSGGASKIISDIGRGRKSAYASKAIIWFSTPREIIHSNCDEIRDIRLVNMSEQIMAHEELIKRFGQVCKENLKLREELKNKRGFLSKLFNKSA